MFQDILSESWVYQEIGQKYLEQGVEKGIEKGIQGQREILMNFVQVKFPELEALAKQQTEGITDPEVLPGVSFKLSSARTAEEARQLLLDLDKM